MQPLTEAQIRSSFVNATKSEAERVPMPGLHEMVWEEREYLGWHDARAPRRAYLTVWQDDRPVSLVLRAAERSSRRGISAMCSLCQMPQPGAQVTLFTAPRPGDAGRNGDTVGMYICADLGCSAIIRIAPPPAPMQIPPEEIVQRRIEGLRSRVHAFTEGVLHA
ncbi:FBP domain-containing protein [uncultured Amnibacterium sp.]|uniref:FBP domain-containing protein n=1 Tax=uncultured Amnibacterium sp. TaxID=1631851 RepID=UPI0035CA7D29